MLSKISTKEMCEGPLWGRIVRYAVPIVLSGILQLLFNTADLIVVGRLGSEHSVAAVGATSSLTHLIVNFFMGFSTGCGVVVAHGLGARDDRRVHQTIHTAIPMAAISGLIITLIGVIGSKQFLTWMGTPEEVLPLSALYMQIYFCGMIANMVYNYGAAILRAAGDSDGPLKFLAISGVLNVVLNIFFIVVFKMDVAGVALATALSQFLAAGLTVRAMMKRTDACKFEWRKLRFYKTPFLKMLRLGLPAGLQSCMYSIANVTIQSSINSFGAIALRGSTAASSLEGFVYTAMNAFNQTALNFTGQNAGARRYDRVWKIFWICTLYVTVVGILAGGGVFLFGKQLLTVYIPMNAEHAAEAIGYGMIRLSMVCLPYFICGIQEIAIGTVRGLGLSFRPMLISIMGVCVFRLVWIFTIFQIPAYHNLQCLFLSYLISWIIIFVANLFLMMVILRKKNLKHV